jgi:hypothetical protein
MFYTGSSQDGAEGIMKVLGLAVVVLAAALGAGPAHAQPKPTLVGSFKDWFVYTAGTGAAKTCYALGQPKQSDPPGLNRDPAFFLISAWPAKKTKGEPSIVSGYQYKEGSKAQVQIGSDKFAFLTKNDGSAGGAWTENAADERRLVAAMKRSASMVVIGVSSRGTLTRDTYSLAGISAALDKVAATCK